MAHFLLTSTPLYGHVTPMVTIGRGLVERGHRVDLLTGRKYADVVTAAGLRHLPLPAEVDYDDAHLEDWLPDRGLHRGIAAGRYDILGMFIRPLAGQHHALQAALTDEAYDAVVVESAFLGALPLIAVPATSRPPVVGVSVTPLALPSRDCAPFGSGLEPHDTRHARFRNRIVQTVLDSGPLRPVQEGLDAALASVGAPPAEGSYFHQATRSDVTFHLAAPGIEYPRREMPASVRLVGPLRLPPYTAPLPSWWPELDGSATVVHVTQGTMANADLSRLLVPTLRALAGEDLLVVAATGGRPVAQLESQLGGRLPTNARVAPFLPYDQLLPRTAVMVTNGGFGGVQQALAHGVPLVVSGRTEDKPEVGARVSWSGTGINLRSDRPSPARIRRAVHRVLADPGYRRGAQRLQHEIAQLGDPVETIAETLDRLARAGHEDPDLPHRAPRATRGPSAR